MTEIENPYRSLVVGVVLAGGQSRRMEGVDKALVPVGGTRLINRAIERMTPQIGEIVLSANGDASRFAHLGHKVIVDEMPGFQGPLAGILAALDWARSHDPQTRFVASVAVDTPFFPTDLVHRFVGTVGHSDKMIAIAKSGDRNHATFGLWPVGLADDLREHLTTQDNRKVMDWVETQEHTTVVFPGMVLDGVEVDPFFNVNAPDDVDTANAIADALMDQAA
ncbi:MAG: molybdenum cofactor guanylyltransferase MobA [Pseudomonadota bacterium]